MNALGNEAMFSSDPETRVYGGVPVRNLWLLMFYASDLFKQQGDQKVASNDVLHNIPNLVSEILCRAVEQRMQRNLSYGYNRNQKILYRVRGRIDFLQTRRHQLETQGKISCKYDEFTVNTPRNCFVKAALDKIVPLLKDQSLAHRCKTLSVRMQRSGVTGSSPPLSEIAAIRFGRHDKEDQRMLSAARLAFELAMPTQSTGRLMLPELSNNVHWIRKLYEKGIAGFYDVILGAKGWKVSAGNRLDWQIEAATEKIGDILPSMKTDIILQNTEEKRRIIVDTKFNEVLRPGQYRNQTIRSGYLYQIYAYLRSQEKAEDTLSMSSEGLLLHPALGYDLYEEVVIQRHPIKFVTLDLTASPDDIRGRLLQIVDGKE